MAGIPSPDTEDSSGTRYAAGAAVAGRLKSVPYRGSGRGPRSGARVIVLRKVFTINMAVDTTCVCKEEGNREL